MNRLKIGIGIDFKGSVLPIQLRYLIMESCTMINLEMILSEMSQLILLNVHLQGNISNISRIRTISPLRWLTLRKIGKTFSFRILNNLCISN